jgi:hypothetical protein
VEIQFRFTNCPDWLDVLIFSRQGDKIKIEAMRQSGTLLGEVEIELVQFNQLADMLLTK